MITPDVLKEMTSYVAPQLTKLARDNGYKGPAFSSCKFVGITNGGQFAYRAHKNVGDTVQYTKVFVTPTGTATIET